MAGTGLASLGANQRRRRKNMRSLALGLLMDGLVGLDATLDAAIGTQEGGFSPGATDPVAVGFV